MYNDYWLADQGFRERAKHGDLRDLIGRPVDENATVTVGPEDTLLIAYGRFKVHDVSQLPVLEGEKIVGLIDEYDVLKAVASGESGFRDLVRKHMSTRLETVAPSASVNDVLRIIEHEHVPNSLRRKLQ
jgi:cystathionine beta-synthase